MARMKSAGSELRIRWFYIWECPTVSPAHSDCLFFFAEIMSMSTFYTLNIKMLTFINGILGNLPELLGLVPALSLGVGRGHSAMPTRAKASALFQLRSSLINYSTRQSLCTP